MKLKLEQLSNHLQQPLRPVYLLSGDEPLLIQEAGDQLRGVARDCGFSEREVFHADASFSWEALLQSSQSLSLFSDKQLIELHIPNGKPGTKGSDMLTQVLAAPSPDNLILIYCPKLDPAAQRSAWFNAIDKAGVIIQFWPIEAQRLPNWIQQRCHHAGLRIDTEAAQLLTDRVEGNLLAAAQEIEKLKLTHAGNSITAEQIIGGVSDNARYELFALIDAALEAKPTRSLKILQGLRAEGTDAIVALGGLTWEIRKLLDLSQHQGGITEMQYKKHRIWGSRKNVVNQALRRLKPAQLSQMLQQCAAIDQTIKGMHRDDPWQLLSVLVLELSGKPCSRRPAY